ncbi:Uncharacterised protein [Vibrio cholerae]|nr:Uncharacterised protein [Vibrio cholerae]
MHVANKTNYAGNGGRKAQIEPHYFGRCVVNLMYRRVTCGR